MWHMSHSVEHRVHFAPILESNRVGRSKSTISGRKCANFSVQTHLHTTLYGKEKNTLLLQLTISSLVPWFSSTFCSVAVWFISASIFTPTSTRLWWVLRCSRSRFNMFLQSDLNKVDTSKFASSCAWTPKCSTKTKLLISTQVWASVQHSSNTE